MNDTSGNPLETATKSVTWLGVVLIALGVLALALPQQSGIAVAVGVGILLLLAGGFRVLFAFLSPSWGSLALRLLFGLAAVVAGVVMIAKPELGLSALTVVMIAYFLADGLTDLLMGFTMPPGAGGLWLVASGVLSLVLGILLWRNWPVSGEMAVPILVGIRLIFTGIVFVAMSRASRAIAAKLT